MKQYSADKIRNIALVGHSGAGKTSLTEAALYLSKASTRMGRTDEGNTVSDFDPEEVRRGISLSTSLVPVEWAGHKLNLLDTPGYADFVGEVIGAVQAVEGAVVVVDSVAGVEVGTEIAWQQLDELGLPRVVVINKMNRENANWTKVLADLEATFHTRFVPMQVPVGHALDFKGVFRLVRGTASLGAEGKEGAVPDEVSAEAERRREALVEVAAEGDDALIVKFLDGEALTPEEVRQGLFAGSKAGKFVPVYLTAATEGTAVAALLDSLIALLPSPLEAPPRRAEDVTSGAEASVTANPGGPLVAQVFKTQADPYVGKLQYVRVFSGSFHADSRAFNVRQGEEERIGPLYVLRGKEQITVGQIPCGDIGAVAKLQHTHTGDTLTDKGQRLAMPRFVAPQPLFAVALHPVTQTDGGKIGAVLQRIVEEDPTLRSFVEPSTKELTLSGMGDTHVDVAVRRMHDKFGVSVTTTVPRVPYRETITRNASAQYRHKKQTGGAGQFAEVHLRVEPRERGAGFEYGNEVFGGSISAQYIPSIEKGVRAVMEEGVIAHSPVVDLKAVVTDGKEHPVDSKDIAFQIAGREAFKEAFRAAGPVLLEPVYSVRIIVPSSQMGDILGDLNTRRAMVQGMEQVGPKAVVSAQVPLAEMQRYSTDLRSMTQGRGYFTAEFSHFAQVPHQQAEAIIAQSGKEAVEAH
jgi:elongation factor G